MNSLGLAFVAATIVTPGVSAQMLINTQTSDNAPTLEVAPANESPAVHAWESTFVDSFRLLMMEHGVRLAAQAATRRELSGPFLRDYGRSVRWPTKWEDGDGWVVNYLGHPSHGAAAGRIWLQNDRRAQSVELSFTRPYWSSRAKAVQWSAVYSLQFEFGPLSEASIGNVGLDRSRTGWVDHVMTPVGALGVLLAEDAVDKYLVRRIEDRLQDRTIGALARMALNPSRTMANVAGGRLPWHRDGRGLR